MRKWNISEADVNVSGSGTNLVVVGCVFNVIVQLSSVNF